MLPAPSSHAARLQRRLRDLVTLAVLALPAPAAFAQAILVAPQSVVLSSRDRTGTVELYNPSSRATEITIRAVYGHPTTTADGDLTLAIIEQPDSTEPSAAGFVDAFPRRLVLQPNQRQTVRLLARPPAEITFGDVLRCVEGPFFDTPALGDPNCPPELRAAWQRMQKNANQTADALTFQHLLDESAAKEKMYYI